MRALGRSPLPDKLEELQEVWGQGCGSVVREWRGGAAGGRSRRLRETELETISSHQHLRTGSLSWGTWLLYTH